MVSVLVADDQPLIRAGLGALIRAAPGLELAGEAENGNDAVARACELRPEVILMDIRMPELDGVGATRRILAQPTPPRILVLTTFDLDEYVYAALRAGASGFLLKDVSAEQLIEAIKMIAAGSQLFAPSVVRRLVEAYLRTDGSGEPFPDLSGLTGREVEVLRLVATGRSNAEIAAELFIGEGTVKTHLNRLMTKLGLASRAQAVVAAYESGLVVPGRLGPTHHDAPTA
jgi:DNA-binding NarL/FixJ family response regulator